VVVLTDGNVGQLMEPAELPPMRPVKKPGEQPAPDWALRGADGRPKRLVSSIHLLPEDEEIFNLKLQARLAAIRRDEVRCAEYQLDDAEWVVVGFGSAGRVAQTAIKLARARGIKVGVFRPLSLYPFPEARLAELAGRVKGFLVVEMNSGQMVEDVRLAVNGRAPVKFYGRMGGVVPYPDEVLSAIEQLSQDEAGKSPVISAPRSVVAHVN
jgi:2-oxoglutarate ferredoxin oxidoreductase subunit alpha